MKRRSVVWQSLAEIGLERCTLLSTQAGLNLGGVLIRVVEEEPYVMSYSVELDRAWATGIVQVDLRHDSERTLTLVRDAENRWARDGRLAPELSGCVDVDIEWTPATNTLPIRRLELEVGETRDVTAAWIRCPSLEIERLEQTYERLDRHRYRYRAGNFVAELEVDDAGLVSRYGSAWAAVFSTGTS